MEVSTEPRNLNRGREDVLEQSDYFMATAFLTAQQSRDPCTQVGAVIVNERNIIVGIGHNGMPNGCENFPWSKQKKSLKDKHLYVCHAEMNAISNKNMADLKNCTIYVTLFPCNECAKIIIQSGIRTIVYMSDKKASTNQTRASKMMFDAAGVIYSQFEPKNKRIIVFDYDEIIRKEEEVTPTDSCTPAKKIRPS